MNPKMANPESFDDRSLDFIDCWIHLTFDI